MPICPVPDGDRYALIRDRILAPWDDYTLTAIRSYQEQEPGQTPLSPYTCGNGHGPLLATRDGLVCDDCEYRQLFVWASTVAFRGPTFFGGKDT
jgi:hypothetical protein